MTDTAPTSSSARSDEHADAIRALVDAAPPLSVRQRERLRLVFQSRAATPDEVPRPGRARSRRAA
ncbi:hypothetical protein [Streptomyces sp. x-80]|uniref:hypothetical protein n=1 Tax=Streptomyces sp. x-80 TaxID=2789282 RepID=UPI00397EDE98